MSSRPTLNDGIEDCRAAALKAGVDLAGVRIVKAHLDWTWGDLYGVMILGATPEIEARCVTFLQAWIDKRLMPFNSYGFQVNAVDRGACTGIPEDSRVSERGRTVGAYYYPCAD